MQIPDKTSQSNIKNILLATDFSPISDTALLYSLRIARRNNAKVYVVHVVADNFFSSETQQRALDDAWREGHRIMTEHFIAGHLDGIDHKLMVEHGGMWDVLSRLISELSIGLLVTGTRGRSRLGKLLLGSVAENIFRQAPIPVLTVGPRTNPQVPEQGLQRIMFCTGFSMHSLNARELAFRIAEQQRSELMLLHVVTEPPPSKEYGEQTAAGAELRLRGLVPPAASLPAPAQTRVEFGPAAEKILQVAQDYHPDLIVLGVRQQEGFARRLRWATAYEVVSNATCPVMTVRMTEER